MDLNNQDTINKIQTKVDFQNIHFKEDSHRLHHQEK